MKTLTFKNNSISQLTKILQLIDVEKSKHRRGKAKLLKALSDKQKELADDFYDINKRYIEVDEETKRVKENDDGSLKYLEGVDKEEYKKEVDELLEEGIGIDLVEYETKIKAFFNALDNDQFQVKKHITLDGGQKIPQEFNDMSFDILMDELEEAFENKENQQKGEDE